MFDTTQNHSDLYQALECGADGKPGGILITSVGQQVLDGVFLGGYKAYETRSFLTKNKITSILSLGHFKPMYKPTEFNHKVRKQHLHKNNLCSFSCIQDYSHCRPSRSKHCSIFSTSNTIYIRST
jgi:hypothetical protein